MADKVRIGVVGAGWPSWQHMGGYREIPDAELVALCDADPVRLADVADRFAVPKRYTSYDEMLDTEKLDAVSVCTPNAFHDEMAIKALRRGLHVHCEKPMAVNGARAREMMKVAESEARVLMVGFQRRFGSEAQFLKRYVDAGKLGDIYFGRAKWVRRRGIPGMGGWFTTKSRSGGGALIDIGVHVLDLALWYMGYPAASRISSSVGSRFGARNLGFPIDTVRPTVAGGTFDVDDYAFAHVDFGDGRSLILETSWAGHIEHDVMTVELWGESGGATLFPLRIFTDEDGTPVNVDPVVPASAGGAATAEHIASTRHFVNVVLGREQLICPPEHGVRVMELIDGIYAAAQSGTGKTK